MKRWLMLAVLVFFALHAKAETDTTGYKQHYFYLIPYPFAATDVLELNNYWIVAGYERKDWNKKSFWGISIGTVMFSKPGSPFLYSSGFDFNRSPGLRLNIERKYLLRKRFYWSGNFFVQGTKTFFNETVNAFTSQQYVNEYHVNRFACSLIPKIGWLLIAKVKPFYFDFSLGFGIKYITSETKNKIGPLGNNPESYSGKPFEHGSKFTYHPVEHLRFGIKF